MVCSIIIDACFEPSRWLLSGGWGFSCHADSVNLKISASTSCVSKPSVSSLFLSSMRL